MPTSRHERTATHLATAALALVAVKPLLDIGEKDAGGGIDLGVVLTAIGAALMIAAFGLVALGARRMPPRPLLLMAGGLALLLVMSAVSYLLVGARDDLLDLFNVRRYPIYGAHVEPTQAIPAEALRLIVGFAPIALLGLMLMRRSFISSRRIALVAGVVLLGAVVHCVLAWLQVAGVIPYSFYFELANWQKIGRASGGYYHPMSLGRLLIFSVFLIYVLKDRLWVPAAVRYALVGLFVATGAVSLHRFTIVCLVVIVAAFEARRVRDLIASRRAGGRVDRRSALLGGGAVAAVAAVVGGLWGGAIWERVRVALTEVGSLDVRSDTFMHGRGAIWNDVADILGRSSLDVWLFGFGYEPWDMHNDWLRVMVIWGLVGVVLTGAILVGLYRVVRASVGRSGRLALVVLFATLVIFGLTQKPLAYPYFLWLFFLGAMAVLAVDADADDGDRPERAVARPEGESVAGDGTIR
ncbi:hypothetical protein DKT68_14705 [Micromonospora acroterricola]|uniref:O-antigen ligase n=1 Tax=Micromonospora acroterricola TaxID=2202421 RepID=A0A317D1T1_9ACTN|nr:hypothetical protein [Micromonospora acroterricola]PWR08649.1 hypothetical protein DKT68_14705 [Micromonospora acroterricola]